MNGINKFVKAAVKKSAFKSVRSGFKTVKRTIGVVTDSNIKQLLRSGSNKTTYSSKVRAGKKIIQQVRKKAKYKGGVKVAAPYFAAAGILVLQTKVAMTIQEKRLKNTVNIGNKQIYDPTGRIGKVRDGYKMVYGKLRRVRGN